MVMPGFGCQGRFPYVQPHLATIDSLHGHMPITVFPIRVLQTLCCDAYLSLTGQRSALILGSNSFFIVCQHLQFVIQLFENLSANVQRPLLINKAGPGDLPQEASNERLRRLNSSNMATLVGLDRSFQEVIHGIRTENCTSSLLPQLFSFLT